MKKSHITIFIPSLEGGGAERVMITLANTFATKGFRVDLVLARKEGVYITEVAPNVQIIDLGAKRILTSIIPLVAYLRHAQPDVMLSALHHANIISILARKISLVKFRLVVSERNSLVSLHSNWKGSFFRIIMGVLYPHADAVIAVSQEGAKELINEFDLMHEKVFAIPNPVDIEHIKALATEPLNHPWYEPGAPPVIIGVGRLAPQKDFSTLIKAFALLHRSHESARLVILGEGPLRGELEALINSEGLNDVVFMPGFEKNPFKWIARSRLFVLSSCFEGFPNVLVQAMACGTPIVSTDCPTGPSEILDGGTYGKLVKVKEPGLLANALNVSLKKYDNCDCQMAVRSFSPNAIAEKYLTALNVNK